MLTSLVLPLLALTSAAQEARAASARTTLTTGMPAPTLAVESWIKGAPVARFEPGKLYVIEFWATWCPPCIASMPHLAELQNEYGDDGLTIIGLTSNDPRNPLEKVREMVAAKGDALNYTIAWDSGRTTYAAYMDAAGRKGIPCSFVVDQKGKIAYIGHPMFLDEPLGELVDGTWDAARDPAQLEQDSEVFFGFYASARSNPKDTLAKLTDFEKAHPKLHALTDPLRLQLTLAAGEPAAAEAVAAKLLERGMATKDVELLLQIAGVCGDPNAKAPPPVLDLALRAAQGASEISGGKDMNALALLARVHAARGDFAAAVTAQTQAIQAAPEKKRASLMKTLEEYQAKSAGQ